MVLDQDTTEDRLFSQSMVNSEVANMLSNIVRVGKVRALSTNGKRVNLELENGLADGNVTGMIPVLMTGSAKVTDYKKPKVGDTMLFLCVGSTLSTGFALPYIMNGSVDPTGKKDWHVFSDNGFNLFYDLPNKEFKASIAGGASLSLKENSGKLALGNTSVELGASNATIIAGGTTVTVSSAGLSVNGVPLMVP